MSIPDVVTAGEDEMMKKKQIFLHLGVQKSGTTTLRSSLDKNRGQLRQFDGIDYICAHKFPIKIDGLDGERSCLGNPMLQCSPDDLRKDERFMQFRSCLMNYRNSTSTKALFHNEVFISNFSATKHSWQILRNELQDFDVSIILTYRRYFEWLPSYYAQVHNPRAIGNDWDKSKLPTFPEWFQLSADCTDQNAFSIQRRWGDETSRSEMHPIESEISRMKLHYQNTRIHNMHAFSGDLVSSFYCNTIDADYTCEHQVKSNEHANPMRNKDYHILALAAYEKGLIKNSDRLKRSEVGKLAEKFHRTSAKVRDSKFPTICLSPQQQEELLNRSLEMEKRLLPEWFASPDGEAAHRSKFSQYIEQGKFCGIDTARVLEEEEWINFFAKTLNLMAKKKVRVNVPKRVRKKKPH
eukprot:CAMPEP_0116010166 /NCGR_PEP_ID=MMETSP0321-20121206/3849_1 /TAXON_ID=163516 /ORGANISM="Leptocylindrus danicus var. danicus, Strain B650" /LENGTH=408 /DNA_ID=CAMNT_0003479233 /DNA_START=374 /DNA_END=1600 /DNA_ORIENTATION=+